MILQRWLKPLGWALLGFAIGGALAVWHILDTIHIDLNAVDAVAMVQHLEMRDNLLLRAGLEGCVGNAEMARAADSLGWRTEYVAAEGTSPVADPGLASGLRVWVLPADPFAKSDFVTFRFDVNDCLIPRVE